MKLLCRRKTLCQGETVLTTIYFTNAQIALKSTAKNLENLVQTRLGAGQLQKASSIKQVLVVGPNIPILHQGQLKRS